MNDTKGRLPTSQTPTDPRSDLNDTEALFEPDETDFKDMFGIEGDDNENDDEKDDTVNTEQDDTLGDIAEAELQLEE